ncbi:hypothetical protein BE15_41805 [Sorangium cellulosum]|uniref:Uncharacterized protein n=1 Tax=Sorangium cellulosum TaxID=56 RepID=A0A150QYA3_SORCE|nr:hypothetical protein BE15_41805 [Sorangium cellulosum]
MLALAELHARRGWALAVPRACATAAARPGPAQADRRAQTLRSRAAGWTRARSAEDDVRDEGRRAK